MITINNKELRLFGISKVLQFLISPSNYNNQGSYWNAGAIRPVKGIKTETYRKLSTKFLFKSNDRETILKNISRFIEEAKDCIFKRDNLYYEVEISDSAEPEIVNMNTYILEIEFSVVDVYEAEKSVTTNASTIINIESPKPCYANLELSCQTNVTSCVVTINDTEITVKNIKGNEAIYIGSGKITAGGKSKIDDIDILEFPILRPGSNTIKVSREDITLTVKYNERW